MGKASKWLMNLLLGRRELEKGGEKEAVVSVAAPEDYLRSPFGAASPVTAKIKRRWSFGRYKDIVKTHKSCKSHDLMDSGRSSASALELETETQRRKSVDSRVSVPVTSETSRTSKAIEHAAGTKIQAAFRSYLARKALRALRGLVKLQALVRGHLVRKQTTTTIRRMQALMAIQVRARFQRVQMAPIIAKSQSSSYRSMPHDRGSKRTASRETVDMNLHERCGELKSARGYQNHTQIERIEQGFTAYHSGDLSISKREHQYQEISFITATHNSPQPLSPTTPKQVPGRASFGHQQQDYSLLPTYMSNTESFSAKARSQSEPKQRPRWNSKTKAKQRPSVDGTSIALPSNQLPSASSSNLKRIAFESQEPCFVELYRTQRRSKDNKCDGGSGIAHSNYRQLLVACEPHATTF